MKAVRKNHQERNFKKASQAEPKETPIKDTIRSIIFYSIIAIAGYWVYDTFFVNMRTNRTIRDIYGLEKSVRAFTTRNRTYQQVATLQYLNYEGQVGSDMYDKKTNTGKNKFGGTINLSGMGSNFFMIEYTNIPKKACMDILKNDFGNALTLYSIRVGGVTYTWDSGTQYPLPIPASHLSHVCLAKNNIQFTFK